MKTILTVKDLRGLIKDMPSETPVVICGEFNYSNVSLIKRGSCKRCGR